MHQGYDAPLGPFSRFFDACPIERFQARSDDVGEEGNLLETGAQNRIRQGGAVPRKLSRMKRLFTSGGLVIAAFAAVPATAAADCEYGPLSAPFAPFGDTADYYLAPGGDFESLTWSAWGGASLVSGVNPFPLAGGERSLKLDSGEGVRSPQMCVSRDTPHLRFMAKGREGQLDVEVRVYRNGRVTDSSSGGVSTSAHRAWAPSRNIDLKVDSLAAGETGSVAVTFRSQGDWLIDDVFIDPYRR
jgi:hypothetical protein